MSITTADSAIVEIAAGISMITGITWIDGAPHAIIQMIGEDYWYMVDCTDNEPLYMAAIHTGRANKLTRGVL
jgi:hypothetical protein